MKKIKIALLSLSVALILIITFFAGSFMGAYQSYMNESIFRSLLLVNDLKLLRQGDVKKQIANKDLLLDAEILTALRSNKTGSSWVLFPFVQNNQQYLHKIANYRKQFPRLPNSNIGKEVDIFISANEELIERYGQENGAIK